MKNVYRIGSAKFQLSFSRSFALESGFLGCCENLQVKRYLLVFPSYLFIQELEIGVRASLQRGAPYTRRGLFRTTAPSFSSLLSTRVVGGGQALAATPSRGRGSHPRKGPFTGFFFFLLKRRGGEKDT